MRCCRCRLGPLVAIAALVGCQPPGPVPEAPSDQEKRELADKTCPAVTKPFFYSIAKDGKTSYVLGTRHAGVPLAKFPSVVRQRFDEARVLVLESELGTVTPPPMARSVEDQLGDELWQKYREIVGAKLAKHVNRRSIAAAVVAVILLYEDTTSALDHELQGLAKTAGKTLVALEDAAKSQAIGDTMLDIENLRALIGAVKRRSQIADSTRADLAQYCAGKVPSGGKPYSERESQKLAESSTERNRAWLPKLEPLLAEGGAFIAVGRSHVTDRGALVDMLRERGYEVWLVHRE